MSVERTAERRCVHCHKPQLNPNNGVVQGDVWYCSYACLDSVMKAKHNAEQASKAMFERERLKGWP